MAVTPWTVGAQSPRWEFRLLIPSTTSGQPPVVPPNFANAVIADFTLRLRRNGLGPNDVGYERAGTGVFSLGDPTIGQVFYQQSVADVATPASYILIVTWTPSAAGQQQNLPYKWETPVDMEL